MQSGVYNMYVKMYPGFVLSGYGKTRRHGKDYTKKEIFYTRRSQGTEDVVCHAGLHGKAPRSIRRQKGKRGEHGLEPLLEFPQEGMDKAG